MNDTRHTAPPGDLMSIARAARALGRSYRQVWYQVDAYGLAHWERGGLPLVSLAELREWFRRLDTPRPRGSEEGGESDT